MQKEGGFSYFSIFSLIYQNQFYTCLHHKNHANCQKTYLLLLHDESDDDILPIFYFFQDDEAYHFVGYMPIDGRLYELDGLQDGPIDHGAISAKQDWLDVVRPIIMRRISV